VCRPEYFRVKQPEGNGVEPEVVLVRATTAVQLPSFSLQGSNVTGSYEDLPEGMQQPSSDLDTAVAKASHEALFEEALLRKHLRYLAPESVSARRISPVGDIYSFGVLAYELLTGRTTEGSPNTPDQIDVLADVHRHVTAETASPWNLFRHQDIVPGASDLSKIVTPPKALSDIVMRCLAIDVADRYGAWVGVLYDLRRFQQICLNPGADLSKFQAGKVDSMSRFKLPQQLIDRQRESEALDQVFQGMEQAIAAQASLKRSARTLFDRKSVQVVTLYGVSGSGKSVMAQRWAATKEAQCLTARAKLDRKFTIRCPLTERIPSQTSQLLGPSFP
jgi:serine/threonine protein kinase